MPLEKYRFKKGRISYSPLLGEYLASHFWGIDLEQWYGKDRMARAAMIATYHAKQMMEAADSQESMDESERKSRQDKAKGKR